MNITLLKLGGSLVTDKSHAYTALPERIKLIADEIARARVSDPDLRLILGNGAGSFAHRSAAKYGTINGFVDENSLYGACVVHKDAIELNRIITEALLKKNIPVFSLQPSAFLMTNGKKLTESNLRIIEGMIQKKYIPFVYGDVIVDQLQGSTIFSTDTIFAIIAAFLSTKGYHVRVIHAGNYPGVLDKDNNVIQKITPESFLEISSSLHENRIVDVTGGMKLKVEEMLKLTALGIESYILDGTQKNRIYQALLGKIKGTTISEK